MRTQQRAPQRPQLRVLRQVAPDQRGVDAQSEPVPHQHQLVRDAARECACNRLQCTRDRGTGTQARAEPVHGEVLRAKATRLEEKLRTYGVEGKVTAIRPGPVVTTFEFKPDPGIKYAKVLGLSEDLCLALECESILVERIPGKSTVGIEVPNRKREIITLREVVESREFREYDSPLTVALGVASRSMRTSGSTSPWPRPGRP